MGYTNIATMNKYYLAMLSEDFVTASKLLNIILVKLRTIDTKLYLCAILAVFFTIKGLDKINENLLISIYIWAGSSVGRATD